MNILLSYIDPATGALIWQIIAGVLIAFAVVIGIWWRKVKTFFKALSVKLFGKKSTEQPTTEIDDELTDLDSPTAEAALTTDPTAEDNIAAEDTAATEDESPAPVEEDKITE